MQRSYSFYSSHSFLPWLALAWLPLLPCTALGAESLTGEQIYRQQCASCHGEAGEGTEKRYPHPLTGDQSVAELAGLIAKTMPKKAPKKCTGPDAQKVAAYIYDTFYSPAAQVRNKPPRIELSRLTVRQYRQAVADLVGTFRTPGRWDEQRGLRGEYFKSRRFQNNERVIDRIDGPIRFDFGTAGPEPEKFQVNAFSIRWEGAVLAPETGEYQFILRTEHAARLWLNNLRQPLIDAWVRSGKDTEHRCSIFLLGGRVYPLRLEFSKAKQGVDDSQDAKGKIPAIKASIALEWQLPHQAPGVIPRRNLSPNRFPEIFVVETPFPPDDRSVGYERGTSVSRAWDLASTDAALEAAAYVIKHLGELAGVGDGAADRQARVRAFLKRFAERAFRRPLTAEEQRLYIDHHFERGLDLDATVKRVVLLVLKSPRFLYLEVGTPDAYTAASYISLGLWDSLPDPELLQAASSGKLVTRAEIASQAERLVSDLRTRAKLRAFLLQWLKVDTVPELSKDAKQFPDFDGAVASDLRTSLDLFLEEVVWSETSDFRQLLLAESLHLNGRLSGLYGGNLPPDAPFQKVSCKPGERAGVLTHPYLMAAFAYTGSSSPIHRGVFLARRVLGLSLRPPPDAFAPLAPDLHPQLTTRERVSLQTQPQACQSCHGTINALGFTLEHFDAIGRYRDREKDRSIDASGVYQTRKGETVKFAGIRDLAIFLANSEEAHDAFAEQLFQYLIKHPVRAFGPRKLADLRQSFAANKYSVRRLLVEITTDAALESVKRQQESR